MSMMACRPKSKNSKGRRAEKNEMGPGNYRRMRGEASGTGAQRQHLKIFIKRFLFKKYYRSRRLH
jgi:hypothetical protein